MARLSLHVIRLTTMTVASLCICFSMTAIASYVPFNTNTKMNVGIGTSTPQATLVVTSGNVGIGTWTAAGGNLIVNGGGNVGIGSAWPGQTLDVNGTVRMMGLSLNLAPLAGGNVLVSNSVGVGTWMPVSTLGAGGTAAGGLNAIEYNSPVGTFAGTETKFSFNGSNVGIGTTNAAELLDVRGTVSISAFEVTPAGNVGIGTWTAAGGNLIVNGGGNVGIGSAWPGQMLDVQGTVRDIGEIIKGNLGIGTSFVNGAGEAALTIMNGNVGIGTWTPAGTLDVEGTVNPVIFNGMNVGIGTSLPSQVLSVKGNISYTGRIVKRTTAYANATSITPNSDTDDISYMANTQGAGTFTVNADAGTNQVNGQSWVLKISSTSVQTFSWNAQYDGGTIGLPTGTLGNSTIQYFAFIWDSVNSKWDYTGNVGGF